MADLMLKNFVIVLTQLTSAINMAYRTLFVLVCLFLYTAIMSRYYYVEGLKDAGFDRETANMKLEQCHGIIRGINK